MFGYESLVKNIFPFSDTHYLRGYKYKSVGTWNIPHVTRKQGLYIAVWVISSHKWTLFTAFSISQRLTAKKPTQMLFDLGQSCQTRKTGTSSWADSIQSRHLFRHLRSWRSLKTFCQMIKCHYHPNYKAADADAICYGLIPLCECPILTDLMSALMHKTTIGLFEKPSELPCISQHLLKYSLIKWMTPQLSERTGSELPVIFRSRLRKGKWKGSESDLVMILMNCWASHLSACCFRICFRHYIQSLDCMLWIGCTTDKTLQWSTYKQRASGQTICSLLQTCASHTNCLNSVQIPTGICSTEAVTQTNRPAEPRLDLMQPSF